LIRKDPVTCARHFQHQVRKFINGVLLNPLSVIGKVQENFYKVEFQMRGSPHIHMLLWVEDSPKLSEDCENRADVISEQLKEGSVNDF
jgi:hypothetical protein